MQFATFRVNLTRRQTAETLTCQDIRASEGPYRTSRRCPTARVRTRLSSTYWFCCPWYLSTVATCGVRAQGQFQHGCDIQYCHAQQQTLVLRPSNSGCRHSLQGDRRIVGGVQQPMPAGHRRWAGSQGCPHTAARGGKEGICTQGQKERQRQGLTLCGRPKAGLLAHRRSITSCSSAFCPLYVVRMLIWLAGYPASLQHGNTGTVVVELVQIVPRDTGKCWSLFWHACP